MGSNSNFLSYRVAYPVNTNRAQIPLNRAIEMWERHLALSRETVIKLANSLSTEQPLRETYLSVPVIRKPSANQLAPQVGKSASGVPA